MLVFSALVARFGLATILLLTSISKLGARDAFRRAVRNFGLVPDRFIDAIVTWLPRFELVLGSALVLGIAPRATGLLAGLAIAAFACAVGISLARGRVIDCGCFGPFSGRITWVTLARNVILVGAGVVVAAAPGRIFVIASLSQGDPSLPPHAGVTAAIAGSSAVLVSLVIAESRRLSRTLRTLPLDEAGEG